MNKGLILVLILAFHFARSEVIKLNGPLDCPPHHVTVYSDRAEVSRHIQFTAKEEGELSLVISGLTSHIDHNSLRVASGIGDATILEVTHQTATTPPVVDEEKKSKLQTELDEVDFNISVVQSEEQRIQKELTFLETWANKQAARELASLESESSFVDMYEKKSSELASKQLKVSARLKSLKKLKQEIEKNIVACTTQGESKSNVGISLKINQPGEINLLLSYVVRDAFWKPNYDVRVSAETMQTEITYYGTIINLSDDDWSDVSVALSTASTAFASPPALNRLVVDLKEEMEKKRTTFSSRTQYSYDDYGAAYPSASSSAPRAPSYAPQAKEKEVSHMTTNVVEGMSAVNFNIPRKASLPSDGIPHKLAIAVLDLPCHMWYEAIPKLSTHAFLKANVTNNSKYPLLAGSANVFLDNNFVSQVHIEYVPGNEKLEISLGIDNGIIVDRKACQVHTSTSGFLIKSTTKTYEHESVIKNTKKIPVLLKVYEQVPKSVTDSITVNLKRPTVSNDDTKLKQSTSEAILDDRNILVWEVTLQPGEERSFVAEYEVEYPAGSNLVMHT